MDILTPQKISELINEVNDIFRSYGKETNFDFVIWVSVWLLLRLSESQDRENSAIAEFDEEKYPVLFSKGVFDNFFEGDITLRIWAYEALIKELNKSDHNPLRPRIRKILLDEHVQGSFRQFLAQAELFSWLEKGLFQFDFSDSVQQRYASLFFENLLANVLQKQRQAEFYTPKPVVNLMIELANPKPGERIYDPCFGTGGLLVESARRIKAAAKTLPAGEWDRLRSQSIFGVDMNPLVHTIALTRIILAGIPEPNLELADSLERPVSSSSDRFDVILACPPWGYTGRVSSRDRFRYSHLFLPSRDMTNLFLQHVMQSLRPEGRAVVAVPEGTLFSGGPDRKLRQHLLQEFLVEGVVSLPAGTFAPFTGIKSNLLLFRRSKPEENVRFLEVQRLAGTKGNPSFKEETPEELAKHFREGMSTERLWEKRIEDLKKRDWELIAKRGGDEDLAKWLDSIKKADPEIQELPLGNVSAVMSGVNYGRETATKARTSLGEMPIVRISDIKENRITQPGLFLTEKAQSRVKPSQFLKADDILLSTSGTIGKIGIVRPEDISEDGLAAKSLVLIRSGESIVPQYLFTLLHSETYRNWMAGRARGSTIQHLSIQTLRHLPIPVPALPLQERLIKEWRERKDADPLSTFLEIVTREDDHLFEEFIELVGGAVKVVSELSDSFESDPLVGLGNLAARCESFVQEFGNRSSLKWSEKWFDHLAEACDNLKDIQHIPKGPGLFALLQGALKSFLEANDVLHKVFEVPEDSDISQKIQGRLNSISDVGQGLIEKTSDMLLKDIHIKTLMGATSLSVGVQNELPVEILNDGPLPIRNFVVETHPDIGAANIPYFAESSKKSVFFEILPQAVPGKFDFSIIWQGRNMRGERIGGHADLAVDIKSTRDALYQTSLGPSPYITGSPIDREEMFFGRKDVIKKIALQLSTSHRANIILLEGNRRSGKTSILNRIIDGKLFPKWIPAYCSFQSGTGHNQKAGLPTAQVFKAIAVSIFKAGIKKGFRTWFPHHEMPKSEGLVFQAAFLKAANHVFAGENPYDAFDLYLQSVFDVIAPKRLLLLLDEFDKIQDGIDTGITSPQVPENLRALLHANPSMTGILCYSKLLRRLREEYWSMLFGLGHPVSVGSLELEDARFLVTRPAEGRLVFTDKARDKIVDLCARQPYLIQKLCNRIFEISAEKAQRTVTEQTVDEASWGMTADDEHFATLWQHHVGSERRRFILSLCARLSDSPDPITRKLIEIKLEEARVDVRRTQDLSDDLMHLRELELLSIDENGSTYHIAVPLMGAWIRRNVDHQGQQSCAAEESEEQI